MTKDAGIKKQGVNNSLPEKSEQSPAGGAVFDAREFLQYVKDFDLTEEQALELITLVYQTMFDFARLGFGLDPVQQIVGAFAENASDEADGAIEWENSSATGEFEEAAMLMAAQDGDEYE